MSHSPYLQREFWSAQTPYVALNPQTALNAAGIESFAHEAPDRQDFLYFQTSGTEGQSKWVGISRAAFLYSARAVNAHLEATSSDRWLIALPIHHVGGFSIFARCHAAGSTLIHWEEKWNPHKFAALCALEKITLASLVPTQVFDLVQAKLHSPASLRAVVVGGGGLSLPLGRQAQEYGWPVLQSYGMTETSSQVATEPLDHLYQGFDPEQLKVLDGWNLQTDATGRLRVRGPGLASGYAIRRKGVWEWEAIDPATGLETRDRVQLWNHGSRTFLRMLGRESQYLKVKGELLHLTTLQSKLDFLRLSLGLTDRLIVQRRCQIPAAKLS